MISTNMTSSQQATSLILYQDDAVQTMTCVEVAELTGKDHANVMRDVRALVESLSMASDLKPCAKSTTYVGKDGRRYPTYELDKETCLTLVLGYDPVARMRVVKRWQELERKAIQDQPAVPQTLPEALRLAAEAIEQRDRLMIANAAQAEALAEAEPKVKALDRIAMSDGSLCIRDAAKTLQFEEIKKFTKLLETHNWCYRRPGGSQLIAYQDKIKSGLMEHKITTGEKSNGTEWVNTQARITPRGMTKLASLIQQQGMH